MVIANSVCWRVLYRRLVVPETEDAVDYVAAYQNASSEERCKIRDADVLVSQVLDFVPRIGDLETRAVVHLVPHITAAFLWPHTGSPHPRNTPAPLLDASGPYPAEIGDSFMNRMIAEKVPADEAVARYLATDVAKVRKLDRLMELFLDRQRKRDVACGFHFADFIEGNFRTSRLFRTPNHPETPLSVMLATEVFGRIGVDGAITATMETQPPSNLFPATEAPLHPSVIAHFGLTYADAQTRYRYFSEGSFTFAEGRVAVYALRMEFDLGRRVPSGKGGPHGAAVVALERAVALSPRSSAGHSVLSEMLARQGRTRESIERAFQAVILEPSNDHFQRRLDHLLAASGI